MEATLLDEHKNQHTDHAVGYSFAPVLYVQPEDSGPITPERLKAFAALTCQQPGEILSSL